jgi:hypothetical protein
VAALFVVVAAAVYLVHRRMPLRESSTLGLSSDERFSLIQDLKRKQETRPAFEENEESDRTIEQWFAELKQLVVRVSSFRDPQAADALAIYIDLPEAQQGLTQLGPAAIPSVLQAAVAPDPDKRIAAIRILARIAAQSKLNAQQQSDVRDSLNSALSDKERAVRELANETIPAYGGQSVAIPKPLFSDMRDLPCFQKDYLAFTRGEEAFVLTFDGPNGVSAHKLTMKDGAKHGIRCAPDRVQVLVIDPYPNEFFSAVSFPLSV